MLEELTRQTGAGAWASASLVFFVVFWIVVTFRVYRTAPEELDAQARMVLDDGVAVTPTHNGSKA